MQSSLEKKPSELIKFERPLRLHQAANLDRFAYQPHMALLWEMGTGKSTEAIAWLRAKYNMNKAVTRTLIVSPVATLYNWLDEFKINAPEAVVNHVLVPYKKSRKMRYSLKERAKLITGSGKNIIVINPESLDSPEVVAALKEFGPVNVVIDEADGWKKPALSSKKAQNGKKQERPTRLGNLVSVTDRAQNRAIMTGTLILNSYLDIWAPWRILDRGETFGPNYFVFRERYFRDANAAWSGKAKYFPLWVPKPGIEGEITAMIGRKASRVLKSECLDLPELVTEKRFVEMGEDQAKAYYELESQLVTEIQNGTCAASNALTKVLRLMQILSGYMPVVMEDGQFDTKAMYFFKDNPRLDQLEADLRELTPNHKVIVWCTFATMYPKIRELFDKLELGYTEITGESNDHQGAKEKFQNDPKCRVILSNPKAGGIGINLVASSYSLYYSYNHSRREREQSKARNHRGGSEIHERITHLDYVARDTINEEILDALQRKEDYSENILANLKEFYRKIKLTA